ncbi:MAG: response regulator [Deltaproteobacteria bacterium]|nr:response regulator [Deltaproteobacteria bacterium]
MAVIEPVGSFLVRTGALSEARVRSLMSQNRDGRILSVALKTGAAPERVMTRALALQKGTPALVLSSSSLDLAALQLVPKVVATTHKILPVAMSEDTLTLAVADVGERPIFDQIRFAVGLRVEVLLALDAALIETIENAYAAFDDGAVHLSGKNAITDATPGKALLSLERPERMDAASISSEIETVVEDPWPQLSEVIALDVKEAIDVGKSGVMNLDDILDEALEKTKDTIRVLVVEDDEAVCGLLERLLKHDGYDVVEANNGRVALTYLKNHKPDLILLDAMLPEVHGFEICRTLKASAVHKDVPVIMVSAVYKGWQHARDIHEVYGADAFIEKPFDANYLRATVGKFLGRGIERTRLSEKWEMRRGHLRYQADALYRDGKLDAAKVILQQLRTLDPFDASAHLMLGNIAHREQGDFEVALKHWEKAATFDPDLFAAHKNMALALEHFGFHHRAIREWGITLELAERAEASAQVPTMIRERIRRLSTVPAA